MGQFDYDVSAAGVKELLAGYGHYAPPALLLQGLTEEQAFIVPMGAPYSIAQIVSHMQFCQQGEIAGVRSKPWPSPLHLEDTFAPVPVGEWQRLVEGFLTGIKECGRLAEERGRATSAQQDDTSVGYDLAGTVEGAVSTRCFISPHCCAAERRAQ